VNDVSEANLDTAYTATNPSDNMPDLSSQTNVDVRHLVNVDTNVEKTTLTA
jgi:hypothetical protein